MPRDLDELLADGAPRDPGHLDLDAIESRAARRRTGRVGAVAVVMVAALALAVQSLPVPPGPPVIGDLEQTVDGTTVLPLPAPGEVTPDHANGRPVFVVHEESGDVRVVDAISPHDNDRSALKVLAYCTTSEWFVDPWHGSKFSRNGAWTGGPAPHGLAEHDVLEVTDDTVVVGGLGSAPARGALQGQERAGQDCGDTSTEVRVEDFVLHEDVDEERAPGLLYPQRPDDDCCGLLAPDRPQVPAGDEVTLPLPPSGEVVATHVDGRPVFVHVDADADEGDPRAVTVLDAVSPLDSWDGDRRVLAWCEEAQIGGVDGPSARPATAGALVDLWYLSTFTVTGHAFDNAESVGLPGLGTGGIPPGGYGGGPAPTGVGRFAVLDVARVAGSEPGTVTITSTPLPPRPRVRGGSGLSESCSDRVALFPGDADADPAVFDDLVLHEPEFPDRWWYPTPERLLGDEPGLPPEELQRFLDMGGDDPGEATEPLSAETVLDALTTGPRTEVPDQQRFVEPGTELVTLARDGDFIFAASEDANGEICFHVLHDVESESDAYSASSCAPLAHLAQNGIALGLGGRGIDGMVRAYLVADGFEDPEYPDLTSAGGTGNVWLFDGSLDDVRGERLDGLRF